MISTPPIVISGPRYHGGALALWADAPRLRATTRDTPRHLRRFVADQAHHHSLPVPRQRESRHLPAPDRAQKRGQAAASTGAAVTYVQGLIQTIQTPPIPPIQCMHGGSYISGASCARTTWLGLISMLKIRLEPLVVLPRCEGEWCGCYPLRTRGNSNEIG